MSGYVIGARLRSTATFSIPGAVDVVTGEEGPRIPTDPTTVILRFEAPGSADPVVYTYPTDTTQLITRDSVGVYHFDFTAIATPRYMCRWEGTGAVIAATIDQTFTIKKSALVGPRDENWDYF